MATTPPAPRDDAERSPDVLCPVQIHVHDRKMRERRRRPTGLRIEKRHRRSDARWIDLDENVLDGYTFIDDKNLGPSVPEIDSEELSYPEDIVQYDNDNDEDDDDGGNDDDGRDEDTGSHGKRDWSIYKQLKRKDPRRYRADLDFGATYPLANSHGNAYQDSSSHSKYTELHSRYRSGGDNFDTTRDLDATPYAIANSHGEHGDPAMDGQNRDYRENSESNNLTWDTRSADVNYEIANSHSNYRVFYDSQTQHQAMVSPWLPESWSENRPEESQSTSKDPKNDIAGKQEEPEMSTNQTERNEEDSGTSDIEQCLVQIEESLLNIEQNLLHVQDLDIPELRNLLYKSPSIERSLYEVQDLLYADGIVSVITKNKSGSFDSDEEEEEEDEEDEIEEEEVWVGQNITIKDSDKDDGNASAPLIYNESSDTINFDERNLSRSIDKHYVDQVNGSNVLLEKEKDLNFQVCPKTALNFVPNSLGETVPRKIVLNEVKENIRICSSKPEESTTTIDYNLNSACSEKKCFFRDKWYSRTNSLDENSIFQNSEVDEKQENKSSLQDVFLKVTGGRRLTANAKARSEGTLQIDEKKRERRGSHEEKLLQAVEATAEDFRKRLESFASQRRSILDRQKGINSTKETSVLRSREKSPTRSKRASTTSVKTQDKDSNAGKNVGDKRKRKKSSGKNQGTSENALIPNKLISLSLSLLLAALLQAVRCLTDLVEDAFRSVSYDRSGLLQ